MAPSPSRPFVRGVTLFDGLAALAAVAVCALPAQAEHRRLPVAHDDLDLSVAADVVELERRVIKAAEAVCRRPAYTSEPVLAFRGCVSETVARVQPMIRELVARQTTDTARIGSGIAPNAR